MKKRDPLLVNKLTAAFLSAALFIMLLSSAVDILTAGGDTLKNDVYEVAEVEAVTDKADTATANTATDNAFDGETFFASAKVKSGKRTIKKCLACHSFDQGGADKVGPNLYNLINREIANNENFAYSSAMKAYKESKKQWAVPDLVRFLKKPKAEVKGTSMGFAGLKEKDIANLLVYLNENYSEQAIDLTK